MTYEEEGKKLIDEHIKEYDKIIKKYEEQDKKYYQEHPKILDGHPPSYEELKKCQKKFSNELKKIKDKYGIQK